MTNISVAIKQLLLDNTDRKNRNSIVTDYTEYILIIKSRISHPMMLQVCVRSHLLALFPLGSEFQTARPTWLLQYTHFLVSFLTWPHHNLEVLIKGVHPPVLRSTSLPFSIYFHVYCFPDVFYFILSAHVPIPLQPLLSHKHKYRYRVCFLISSFVWCSSRLFQVSILAHLEI